MSNTKIIVPKLTDPRVGFLTFAVFFISYSIYAVHFGRNAGQFILVCLTFSTMDVLFHYLYNKHIIFPVSGIVSSIGAFLLADTSSVAILTLLAFVTIGSKFFLKIGKRHIFNPNNFGLLIISLAFPTMISPTGGIRWGGEIWLSVTIFIMGLLMVYWAKRILVSLTYISTFFILGYLLKLQTINYSVFTLLGPGIQLFIFFMISDPKTSPHNPKLQILFGVFIAVFDHLLRFFEFRLATLTALAMSCLLYSIINIYIKDKESRDPWHTSIRDIRG